MCQAGELSEDALLAGVSEFLDYDDERDSPRDVVARIYKAIEDRRRASPERKRDEMLRAMWLYRTDNLSKPQFRKFLEDRRVPSDKIERMLVTYSWENAG